MLRNLWNRLSDCEDIASGIVVISSIFMACAGLTVAMVF